MSYNLHASKSRAEGNTGNIDNRRSKRYSANFLGKELWHMRSAKDSRKANELVKTEEWQITTEKAEECRREIENAKE